MMKVNKMKMTERLRILFLRLGNNGKIVISRLQPIYLMLVMKKMSGRKKYLMQVSPINNMISTSYPIRNHSCLTFSMGEIMHNSPMWIPLKPIVRNNYRYFMQNKKPLRC
eukprot:Lithocolla_globosa_v1_NODE_526_length_3808_cov_6.745004.p4 type:complete len:110 gc:universal NODE_526_length_3808_cov_6.745004:956-627(-)